MSAADDYLRAGKTVEETNALITDSTILSKIANIDAADATTYLISAMNAYGLAASEVLSVVDKLSAVDVEASVSSEGLAIAMSKTASSAQLAGVSMDKLFGYIAAVKEVSQESDETIGNFYKTLFARMQQVKIGSLVDSEGDDISDVSKVLKQYGIDILDSTGELRNMGDVLDELSGKWDKFTNAQKSEIATTLAGVRQRDRKQRRRLSIEICYENNTYMQVNPKALHQNIKMKNALLIRYESRKNARIA
jgi:TP901 family phage tail tape measure protein